ncbi:MAG: diaminopimelate epimerase, partial [Treponema sp.]|nr:diaminopimelate epimerase [Treponema sp.]
IQEKHCRRNDNTETITIETDSGVKKLVLYKQNGKVTSVSVDMGKPAFESASLPTSLKETPVPSSELNKGKEALLPKKAVINADLTVAGTNYKVTCLGVGNPHCVVFSKFVDKEPVDRIGPLFENHEAFPERVNTEFVRVAGPNELKMRTWERSNGETLACGTGACAAAVAAVLNGYSPLGTDITVQVRGGSLSVRYTGETVYLTGNTTLCYEGEVEI